MTDSATNTSIRVSPDENTGPYMVVPTSQLDQIRGLLAANGFRFWVSHNEISVDGKPPVNFVYFRRGTDAQQVQALLDTVA